MNTTQAITRTIHAPGLTGLAMAVLAMTFGSCSEQPQAPQAPAPSATVRQEGSKTVVTDAESGAQLVFGATDVPEDFPGDLPVYPEAALRSHFKQKSTVFTTFIADTDVDTLKTFFLEGSRLQQLGWEIGRTGPQGIAFTIDMRKGNRRAMINLKPVHSPEGTSISYVARID